MMDGAHSSNVVIQDFMHTPHQGVIQHRTLSPLYLYTPLFLLSHTPLNKAQGITYAYVGQGLAGSYNSSQLSAILQC